MSMCAAVLSEGGGRVSGAGARGGLQHHTVTASASAGERRVEDCRPRTEGKTFRQVLEGNETSSCDLTPPTAASANERGGTGGRSQ